MPVNTTTGAAYAMNVGAVGIVGSFLGLPLEAMIFGTIAGAVVPQTLSDEVVRMVGNFELLGAYAARP